MNDSEKQTIVFIPRNFIEKGTFMGGMFKIRNAIEGGILAVLIAVPVIQLPLSLTVRIIILCMTALPAAMISLIGIGGESISAFLMNYLAAEADEPDVGGDKITISLQKAAQFAATVIVKDGALGVGYDVDPSRLPEIINLQL